MGGNSKSKFTCKMLYKVLSYLSPKQKKKLNVLLVLIFFNSLLDIIGLVSILPVITIAMKPEIIHTSLFIENLFLIFSFDSEELFIITLFLLSFILILLRNILAVLVIKIQGMFCFEIANNFTLKQLKYYVEKELDFINDSNSDLIMRTITIIPQNFANYIMLPQMIIFSELLILGFIFIGLMLYNPLVFLLILLIILPITFLFYSKVKRRIQVYGKEKDQVGLSLSFNTHQFVNGFIEVKLFHKFNFFKKRIEKDLTSLKSNSNKLLVINSLSGRIIEIIAFVGVFIILIYAMYFSKDRTYFISLIGVFIAATYRLIPTYNRILHSLLLLKEYSYVFDFMDKIVSIDGVKLSDEIGVLSFKERIEFRSISFKYPDTELYVLNNFDLTVQKGDIVGIIGKSGSGKTTLINVLLRFNIETQGDIFIDKMKVTNERKDQLRGIIGYVPQRVFILDGTFVDNIAFGIEPEKIDYIKLHEAIEKSRLGQVIYNLPNGINTRIGENGSKLSGGQKQRVAIARALYKDAEIFILDEATSALDNETELEINETVLDLKSHKKTVIIVAHRYTSLKECRVIHKLYNGKIESSFSYEELVNLM